MTMTLSANNSDIMNSFSGLKKYFGLKGEVFFITGRGFSNFPGSVKPRNKAVAIYYGNNDYVLPVFDLMSDAIAFSKTKAADFASVRSFKEASNTLASRADLLHRYCGKIEPYVTTARKLSAILVNESKSLETSKTLRSLLDKLKRVSKSLSQALDANLSASERSFALELSQRSKRFEQNANLTRDLIHTKYGVEYFDLLSSAITLYEALKLMDDLTSMLKDVDRSSYAA